MAYILKPVSSTHAHTVGTVYCVLCKYCPCAIHMLTSLLLYLVSMGLGIVMLVFLTQGCVNNAYSSFSALLIKADHPMAGQKRE